MSDVQLYLLEFESSKQEAAKAAKATADKLESKSIKLIELIETLDEYLNNEDGAVREKTMAYLSDVLAALPSKVVSRQQRDLLSDFILSRIANGAEGLGYCARALIALEKLGKFDDERVVKITNTLLESTSPLTQSKLQSERFAVLSLLDVLISKYRKSLQDFHEASKDFMRRFVAYFDGEKDPRNLMVVFSILNVPMVEWDISADAQDLFEAVFNYFPITFRPPPGDPFGITAQQLKDRLRDCISSTAFFAPYAFPALLDKLDSTSANVKRDAIQAVTSCVERYGPTTVNLYSITLWDALKFEVLNAQEGDLAQESLKALREIAVQLSTSVHPGPLQAYIKPVAKECNEHFEDAPTKQSSAASKIIDNVASASPESFDLLTKAVMPQLLALYQSADLMSRRRALLEGIQFLFKASIEIYGRWRPTMTGSLKTIKIAPNAILEYKDQCVEVLTTVLTNTPITEVSFRLLALEGLRDFCSVRQLLDDVSIAKVVRLFIDIVITEASYCRDDIKAAAIDAIVDIAHQKPQIIIETAIPVFMGHLPDTDKEMKANTAVLEAFAKLSQEQQIFDTVILRLKNKLYAAIRQQASPKYVLSILLAILYAFSHGALEISSPSSYAPYYANIVVPLLSDFCTPVPHADNLVSHEEAILYAIGRICNSIVRTQRFAAQTEISGNIYTFFSHLDRSQVPPFDQGTHNSQQTMIVSTQLLAALQREARPFPDIGNLLTSLIKFVSHGFAPTSVEDTALQQISLITNKFISSEDNLILIKPLLSPSDAQSLLSSTNRNKHALVTALAILKGLALRLDPLLNSIVPAFLALLTHPTSGWIIAHGLSTLLNPSDLFTKENHCVIYGLHKQRVFSLTVPFLCSNFRNLPANDVAKKNYLVALAGILQHTPYALIKPELSALVPLLLQSLASDAGTVTNNDSAVRPRAKDAPVRAAAVALFATIIVQDPSAVEEHVGSLVGRLLAIATVPIAATVDSKSPNLPPKLRAAALACLASFVGSLKDSALLPYKLQVVKRLANALDDGKRAVRAEAVRCRMKWEGLGGEDDE